jgi:hypothetical protein
MHIITQHAYTHTHRLREHAHISIAMFICLTLHERVHVSHMRRPAASSSNGSWHTQAAPSTAEGPDDVGNFPLRKASPSTVRVEARLSNAVPPPWQPKNLLQLAFGTLLCDFIDLRRSGNGGNDEPTRDDQLGLSHSSLSVFSGTVLYDMSSK